MPFIIGRNPLKSGQCFLLSPLEEYLMEVLDKSRNPLKSGQCFLPQLGVEKIENENVGKVAIPSNRVNVSYNVYI